MIILIMDKFNIPFVMIAEIRLQIRHNSFMKIIGDYPTSNY